MNFDEEAPPLLVNVDVEENKSPEEPKSIKVPITIVTGKPLEISCVAYANCQ